MYQLFTYMKGDKMATWTRGNGLVNIPYLHGAYGNGIRFHQIGWYPGNSRVFPFQKSYMLSAQTSCFRSLSISAGTAQRAPLFCYADFCRRNWPKPELRMEVPKHLQSCWWEIPSCKREILNPPSKVYLSPIEKWMIRWICIHLP